MHCLNKVNLFGINFVKASYRELLDGLFREAINPLKKPKLVFTPNNEMIVEAKRNPDFLKVLKEADYALPDSTGVFLSSKLLAWPGLSQRLTGVDLTKQFLEENQKYKVFLLGGKKGAAACLLNKYTKIVDYYDGVVNQETTEKILRKISFSGAEILFVALGAPKQEKWLVENREKLKGVKLAFGIGGSLDFLAGIQKRAPKFVRSVGLEWLWRLTTDFSRIKRIYRATIVFAWVVGKEMFARK